MRQRHHPYMVSALIFLCFYFFLLCFSFHSSLFLFLLSFSFFSTSFLSFILLLSEKSSKEKNLEFFSSKTLKKLGKFSERRIKERKEESKREERMEEERKVKKERNKEE